MSTSRSVRALCLAAVLGVLGTQAQPQTAGQPIPQVRIEKIASARLGETREVWISLPDRYDETQDRYPVLYLLDGEINFNSGQVGGIRYSASLGEIPELIVVGVVNTDRSRDIFPEVVTYQDGSRDGGRADSFLDFLRDELVPRIDGAYRTLPSRILYGTSNTGFTAVYALFKRPDLAEAYIAASATLSIPIFRGRRDGWIRDFKGGNRRLILVTGENDLPTILSQNGALKEALAASAPAGLSSRLAVIESGEHVPGAALLKGLKLVYEGWKPAASGRSGASSGEEHPPMGSSAVAELREALSGRDRIGRQPSRGHLPYVE
jgi:predicted alpha/beta superfamily hydrolase